MNRDIRLVEMRPEIVNNFIGYVASDKNRTQEIQRTIVDDVSDDTSCIRVNDDHMTLSKETQELSCFRIYFRNNGA